MAGNFEHVRMLLIDNYDSFTYNLVQAFAAQGAEVMVYRNDAITVEEAKALEPTHLVIPILGVCLGHQSLVYHFGGAIVRAERLMHGKTSMAKHDGRTIFEGLSQPFEVGRYHSLCAEPQTLPDVLELTAETERGEIMGVRHKSLPLEGVQFHPESVLTPEGDLLMANFMRMKAS
jgi:anthranilate/para-aminobenzoate synthase component II